MNIDDVKELLEAAKDDPEVLKPAQDEIDRLIGDVILIEKKHLYQIETTSNRKRLEEIRKLLDDRLPKMEDC